MSPPLPENQQRWAKLMMHGAVFCGSIALFAFVLFLLMGPFDWIALKFSHRGSLALDLGLSSLFFIQHSGMIRRGLRARMTLFVPAHYNRAIFTLASSAALILVVLLWQPTHIDLLQPSAAARWLGHGLFFLAAVGMGWGALVFKTFDPFGRKAIRQQLYGKCLKTEPFIIKGPYRWVRHPLYFFTLVMIWSRVELTTDRLLFNLLWSGWIYLGTVLEEKDLVIDFGGPYEHYQKQVPMLIPWKGLAAQNNNDP